MSEDDDLPPARRQQKRESSIGNAIEAVLTYLFPLAMYTPVMIIWVLWGSDPSTIGEQVVGYRVFFILTLITIGLYGLGCLIGSEARFSDKPHRVLLGGVAAASPILLPILMWARGGPGPDSFQASSLDVEFAGFVIGVAVILSLAFLKMYTAVRRVHEVSRE